MIPTSACPGRRRRIGIAPLLATTLLLAACANTGPRPAAHPAIDLGALPPRTVPSGPWPDPSVRQLVVVLTPGWDAPDGRLARFERDTGGPWRPVATPIPVTVGRSGSAWGVGLNAPQDEGPQKQEGDGRAPAGVFALGTAFGDAPTAPSGLPYQAMTREDWCVDVPGSPLYNRIVSTRVVGEAAVRGSTEPMRRDLHKNGDPRYALGFVIEHNAEGHDRAGSCIFAHVWDSPTTPTAGCTAMARADIEALVTWLDPAKTPRFVLLPVQAYARLQAAWDLPVPTRADAAKEPHE